MTQTPLQKVSSAVQNHFNFAFDFYGLDFWKDHSPLEGYQVAVDEFADVTEDKLAGRSSWLQAGAASTLEVARLFGAMPVAVHHWWIEAAKESQQGVWAMVYRLGEVPVQGFVHGARHVGDSAQGWFRGSLNERSSFRIASEVTGVLGAVVFMAMGAESIASGGGKIVRGAKTVAADVSSFAVSSNLAAATATASIDGALILQGVKQAMGGPVYWMAAGDSPRSGKMSDEEWEEFGRKLDEAAPLFSKLGSSPARFTKPRAPRGRARVDDATLAAALARHEGNQVQAGRELSQPSWRVSRRVLRSTPDSPLWPFRELKGKKGGSLPQVDDKALAAALEKSQGNRSQAAREVGMTYTAVSQRVLRSAANSPLAGYKSVRGGTKPRGSFKQKVSDRSLAKALERHSGHRLRAGQEVGLRKRVVIRRIHVAKPGSVLEPFKTKTYRSEHHYAVSDEQLAAALERHSDHRLRAGQEVGLSKYRVSQRIHAAKPGSALEPFKTRTYQEAHRVVVSDEQLAAALERHSGHRERAGQEVGLNSRRVSKRIRAAKPGSVLEPFKTKTYQKAHRLAVSDEQLAEVLRRHRGNRMAAATELSLSKSNVIQRVRKAGPNNPLAPFKGMKGPGRSRQRKRAVRVTTGQREDGLHTADIREGRLSIVAHRLQAAPDLSPLARLAKGRVTDSRIARILDIFAGSIEKAAPVLGLSPQVIRLRLRLLREHPEWQGQSPLVPYLTLPE